jgi:hypothetical protein
MNKVYGRFDTANLLDAVGRSNSASSRTPNSEAITRQVAGTVANATGSTFTATSSLAHSVDRST